MRTRHITISISIVLLKVSISRCPSQQLSVPAEFLESNFLFTDRNEHLGVIVGPSPYYNP
eukprot:COSAG01_NODE_3032_length_6694_cov_13.505231_8_plen_59_part_01